MPRFKVVEERAYKSATLIDAADEDAASHFRGEVIEQVETDSWGERLLSVERVADDEEEVSTD